MKYFKALVMDAGRTCLKPLNPLYTIESVELNEKSPAAQWVGEIANADGIDPRTIRSVGDVLNLAQMVENGNRALSQSAAGNRGYTTTTGLPPCWLLTNPPGLAHPVCRCGQSRNRV